MFLAAGRDAEHRSAASDRSTALVRSSIELTVQERHATVGPPAIAVVPAAIDNFFRTVWRNAENRPIAEPLVVAAPDCSPVDRAVQHRKVTRRSVSVGTLLKAVE